MSKNLFVTSTEARSGKTTISLGIMELLLRYFDRVAFFRPIINFDSAEKKPDNDINLLASYFNLKLRQDTLFAYTAAEASNLLAMGKLEELLDGILNKYAQIEKDHDFILCEGIEFEGSTSSFEFDINAEISNNLGCPVLLVANAHNKAMNDIISSIQMYHKSLLEKGCDLIATVVNRIDPETREEIISRLEEKQLREGRLLYSVPYEKTIGSPTVGEIAQDLDAEILYGGDQLYRHVYSFTVAAMQLRNLLKRITHGTLIITPGDRSDVIVACLSAVSSLSMPNISGMMLTGGLKPEEPVCKLIEGFSNVVPILSVKTDTFPSARAVDKVYAVTAPENHRKIARILDIFEANVDLKELGEKIIKTKTTVVTPKMFEYELLQKAKRIKQHIVLPEGNEDRILKAAEILVRKDVAQLTLLGNEKRIREKIARLGIYLDDVNIIEPAKSDLLENYVQTYYELRQHRGITHDNSHDIMVDETYFGTMMVYKNHADGMVSGAVHTTGDTVRPAFQIIKTKPDYSIVSSVLFICLEDRVLVYGDCAVNPNPDTNQLSEIALSSAQTALTFGIEPIVAMLSYSTGGSGRGEDVDRVREATAIARKKASDSLPGLKLEGPIQYDAAVDLGVAKTKLPNSEVAGQATVFIFPDLNTGNNTYKAVQRSAGAVVIGPVLQGLNKPVNDLSRGCLIPDIVNTVAITSIQAQAEKGLI